jgi:hypothetical protein
MLGLTPLGVNVPHVPSAQNVEARFTLLGVNVLSFIFF